MKTPTESTPKPLALPGTRLPFEHYQDAQGWVLRFDATGTPCPVPMVHAMAGLEWIAANGGDLLMINGFEPQGLYERVSGYFNWTVTALDDERVAVRFSACGDKAQLLDFSQRHCRGG